MGSLECPLCCKESFPDKWSLKCHLSNLTVSCPVCLQVFGSIVDLANHLDDSCDNDCRVARSLTVSDDTVVTKSAASKVFAPRGTCEEASSNPLVTSSAKRSPSNQSSESGNAAQYFANYEVPVVKYQSIVGSQDVDMIEQWEQDNDEAADLNYVCVTCNCRIQGVVEHVAKFHPNQLQVYLQTAEVVTVMPDTPVAGDIPSDDTVKRPFVRDSLAARRMTSNMVETFGSDSEPDHEDTVSDDGSNQDNSPVLLKNVVRKRSTANTGQTVRNGISRKPPVSKQVAKHKDLLSDEITNKNISPVLLNNVVRKRRRSNTNTVKTVESNSSRKPLAPPLAVEHIPGDEANADNNGNNVRDDDGGSNGLATSIGTTVESKGDKLPTSQRDNGSQGTLTTSAANLVSRTGPNPLSLSQLAEPSNARAIDDNGYNKLEIIQKRDMVDKTGMPYIRNVVKINRFWEDLGSRIASSSRINRSVPSPITKVNRSKTTSKVNRSTPTSKVSQSTGDEVDAKEAGREVGDAKEVGKEVGDAKEVEKGSTPTTVITRKILKSAKKGKLTQDEANQGCLPLLVALKQLARNGPLISIEAASAIALTPDSTEKPKLSIHKLLGEVAGDGKAPGDGEAIGDSEATGDGKTDGDSEAAGDGEHEDKAQETGPSAKAPRRVKKESIVVTRAKPKKPKKKAKKKVSLSALLRRRIKSRVALFKSPPDGVTERTDPTLVCNVCRAEFPNHARFSDHECRPPERSASKPCEVCWAECMSVGDLNMHRALHLGDAARADVVRRRERRCETCNAVSYRPATFRAHYNAHVLDGSAADRPVGLLACDRCRQVFPSRAQLAAHLSTHDRPLTDEVEVEVDFEGETFTCDLCDKRLPLGGRGAHERMHRGAQPLRCDECNKPFPLQSDLDLHMVVHTRRENDVGCFYCALRFDNVFAMRAHVKEAHTVLDRPYACSFCGRRFFRAMERQRHEKIHTGEKNLKCQVCGGQFRTTTCLKRHILTHTGARPYECSFCDKGFQTVFGLKNHEATHNPDQPFNCPFCPKSFKTDVQMRNHKNQHDRPFGCAECGRKFADLFTLRTHIAAHKKGDMCHVCFVCGASYGRAYALDDHIKSHPMHKPGETSPRSPRKSTRKRAKKSSFADTNSD